MTAPAAPRCQHVDCPEQAVALVSYQMAVPDRRCEFPYCREHAEMILSEPGTWPDASERAL